MSENVNSLFGQAVESRRESLQMNKSVVAKQMGLRSDMLGRLERGERRWTAEYMKKVAVALDTSVGDLLGETPKTLDPFDEALIAVRKSSGERAAIVLLLDRLEEKSARIE